MTHNVVDAHNVAHDIENNTIEINKELYLQNINEVLIPYYNAYLNEKKDIEINSINILSDCGNIPKNVYGSLNAMENKNAVEFVKYLTLSKNNRIRLIRDCDAIKGVTIGSVENPSEDIKSVTLYVGLILPKYELCKVDDILTYSRDHDGYVSKNYSDYIYDENKCFRHYIPIKTVNNPQSNYIEFFDEHIMLCAERLKSFSIEVEFNNVPVNVPKIIGIHQYVFADTLRWKICPPRFQIKSFPKNN